MDRRAFVTGLGAVLAAPLAAEAQQPGKAYRPGVLSNVPPTTPEVSRNWEAFRQGLRDRGWVEGVRISRSSTAGQKGESSDSPPSRRR
jgi:hypothetical protein